MEKSSKFGTSLIILGAALNFTSFFVGVNAGGIILMFLAIVFVGYGAGTLMDTPCSMMEK